MKGDQICYLAVIQAETKFASLIEGEFMIKTTIVAGMKAAMAITISTFSKIERNRSKAPLIIYYLNKLELQLIFTLFVKFIVVLKLIMILLKRAWAYKFAKISHKEIRQSNYDQLIDRIANQYGQRQLKVPSAMSLLEIHHLYKIFKPGDWVLDVGAGPYESWTDLALKLTKNSQRNNLTISNDLLLNQTKKQNNIKVCGDFFQQSVKSNIAMHLLERQLDLIMIDATPEYSGDPSIDGNIIMKFFYESLHFSQRYLKKGGSIVMRTLECVQTTENQDRSKFFFNEVYKHKPSNIPIKYFSQFYVFKGYKMSSRLEQSQRFLKQYKKALPKKKSEIIKRYEGEFDWDIIKLANSDAKANIFDLKGKGHRNSQIIKIYQNEPYIKAKEYVKYIDILNDQKASPAAQIKAKQFLKYDRIVTDEKFLPQNQREFKETILYFSQQQKKKTETQKSKNKDQKKPLDDNQVYMKEDKVQEEINPLERPYLQDDLLGYPSQTSQPENSQFQEQQLSKLLDSLPKIEGLQDPSSSQNKQKIINAFKQGYRTRGQAAKAYKNRQKKQYAQGEKPIVDLLQRNVKENEKYQKNMSMEDQKQKRQALFSGDEYFRQSDKQQYLSSKPEKTQRFVNQRRSKRKGKQKLF